MASCSDDAPVAASTTRHFEPRYSPVASYQRTTGVRTVAIVGSACNMTHSASRSLVKTPLPGGGSPRRMKTSTEPSPHVTEARALMRLYPPVIGSQLVTRPARCGSTTARNCSRRAPRLSCIATCFLESHQVRVDRREVVHL